MEDFDFDLKSYIHICLVRAVSDFFILLAQGFVQKSLKVEKVNSHRNLHVSDSKLTIRRYFMYDFQLKVPLQLCPTNLELHQYVSLLTLYTLWFYKIT